jgi:hypothetical protein
VAPGLHEKLAAELVLAERGTTEMRGKRPMRTWFVKGRRREDTMVPPDGESSARLPA